jgi:hypothetical protein
LERNGTLSNGTGFPAVTFPGGFSTPTASAPLNAAMPLAWAEDDLAVVEQELTHRMDLMNDEHLLRFTYRNIVNGGAGGPRPTMMMSTISTL